MQLAVASEQPFLSAHDAHAVVHEERSSVSVDVHASEHAVSFGLQALRHDVSRCVAELLHWIACVSHGFGALQPPSELVLDAS